MKKTLLLLVALLCAGVVYAAPVKAPVKAPLLSFAPQFAVSEVTALQCSRLDQEFLRDEREALGERWYNQEYMIQFVDSVDSVFSHDLIDAMVQPRGGGAFQPWFE